MSNITNKDLYEKISELKKDLNYFYGYKDTDSVDEIMDDVKSQNGIPFHMVLSFLTHKKGLQFYTNYNSRIFIISNDSEGDILFRRKLNGNNFIMTHVPLELFKSMWIKM